MISFFWGFSTVKSFTAKAKGICRSTSRRILLTHHAWECNMRCNGEIGNFNRNVLSKIFVWEFRSDGLILYVLNISVTSWISFPRSFEMLREIANRFYFRFWWNFQGLSRKLLSEMHIIFYTVIYGSLYTQESI